MRGFWGDDRRKIPSFASLISGLFCLFQDSGRPGDGAGLASLIRSGETTEEKSLYSLRSYPVLFVCFRIQASLVMGQD